METSSIQDINQLFEHLEEMSWLELYELQEQYIKLENYERCMEIQKVLNKKEQHINNIKW